jgi:hypothetical protein
MCTLESTNELFYLTSVADTVSACEFSPTGKVITYDRPREDFPKTLLLYRVKSVSRETKTCIIDDDYVIFGTLTADGSYTLYNLTLILGQD